MFFGANHKHIYHNEKISNEAIRSIDNMPDSDCTTIKTLRGLEKKKETISLTITTYKLNCTERFAERRVK